MLESIGKFFIRLVFPNLVQEMELEGTFKLDLGDPISSLEEADFIRVEDNGADVTIFAFSGMDVLYAGHSKYHLMGVLKRLGRKVGGVNFVFLRDRQRLGFMLRPDGERLGWNFYEGVVRKAMEDLGAPHNVVIGSSVGGTAAHAMAYRCGMQQVITFSAPFNVNSYLRPACILRTLFNFKQLYREPRGYLEIIMVTISTAWSHLMIKKKVGYENFEDLVARYGEIEPKPAVTLYYGEFAPPDRAQAMLMKKYPEVKLVPVPTAGHNTAGYLYTHGQLGPAIVDEISAAMKSGAGQPA